MKYLLFLILFVFALPAFGQSAKRYPVSAVNYYLQHLSTQIVGRPLTKTERDRIKAEKGKAISPILKEWMSADYFVKSTRRMVEKLLNTSGTNNSVDYNLPGNLAEFIVREELPYSQIITADYCVKDNKKTSCDSGAPYTAGVLTTKAFLVKTDGRFNLGRAGTMLKKFACQEYPMDTSIQIPIYRVRLIPMFQVDESRAEDFGNGLACYRCHSQFGAHAQLFVKFSGAGTYVPEATGAQDPSQEAGKSTHGTYTSHLSGREKDSEASQMFGQQVANLAEAAKVMSEHPLFLQCSIRNLLHHFLKISAEDADHVGEPLLNEIAAKIKTIENNPKTRTILLEALTHPLVIDSVLTSGVKNEI